MPASSKPKGDSLYTCSSSHGRKVYFTTSMIKNGHTDIQYDQCLATKPNVQLLCGPMSSSAFGHPHGLQSATTRPFPAQLFLFDIGCSGSQPSRTLYLQED